MHALELSVKNIHKLASKRSASCLAMCETLASKIFVDTGKRPDLFGMGSYHYHLRINNLDIVDPTMSQFFNIPANYQAKVFIGSLQTLKQHIDKMASEFGFNNNHLYIKANKPKSATDLYALWTQAGLNKSGKRLRKMVIPRSGRQKAWYD